MGKRNRSLLSGAAFTRNGPALSCNWQARPIDWSGVIRENELLLLGPNKAAAATARLTTVASAWLKELMSVD